MMSRTPWWLWALILFLSLVPLSIHAVRWTEGNPLPPGGMPYYHVRLAEEALQGNIMGPDPLLPSRTPVRTPLHLMLAAFQIFFLPAGAMMAVPWLCGLAILLLLNAILAKFRVAYTSRAVVLLVLGVSPAFLSMATLAEPPGIALALLLAGTYALLLDGKHDRIGAAFLLACASFGIIEALIAILVPLALLRSQGQPLPKLPFALAGGMLILRTVQRWISETPSFLPGPGIAHQFSDFGGQWGIPLFTFALALVGVMHFWKSTERRGIKAAGVALSIAGFAYPSATAYATPVIALFAGMYLAHAARITWALPDLKRFFLFIVVCGIAFAGISHAFNTARLQPGPALADGLIALRSLPPEYGTVLSHPHAGAWIEFFANRPVILDDDYLGVPSVNRRYADVQAMLFSTDLRKTRELLDEYDVTYVLITKEMENGDVWTRPDQGLLFLLQSNETFKRRSATGFTSAWEYIGRGAGSP